MLYFCRDIFKVEALDLETSIITIQVPSSIAKEVISLLDHLFHASCWLQTQIKCSQAPINPVLVRSAQK